MNSSINPVAYQPILQVVAKGESAGNYNAYFGNVTNTNPRFTTMSIKEVLEWQDAYVASGAASNAVGRYQIMGSTLRGLVKQLHINTADRFDERMQDRLAIALINRRGAAEFAQKKISADEFATNLAMEWAALPKANSAQSYYAGDGLNASRVSSDEIKNAIALFRSNAIK